jgi:23S rRNA pseudouridine1911/1915/1917 synthase
LRRFVVSEDDAGERLDSALAELAGVARAQARRWIDAGCVRGEARRARRVRAGDVLEVEPPDPLPLVAQAEALPLRVLYEDPDLIVIDKAAGQVVHPGPGHPRGTLVNALLYHCGDLAGIGGVLRPGIVHRLDRGTSGVLVAAKHDTSHQHLAAQFSDHSVGRLYVCIVRGVPIAETGRVDRAIGRHPRDRKRMSVSTRHGKAAVSHYRVVERFRRAGLALLEVRPETGRTHQIRVHLASVGLPLLADEVYGRSRGGARPGGIDRPALHAQSLTFDHPRSGERLEFGAQPPVDFVEMIEWARAREQSGA